MKKILYRIQITGIRYAEVYYVSSENEKEAIIEAVLSTDKSIDTIEIKYLSHFENILVAKENVKEL